MGKENRIKRVLAAILPVLAIVFVAGGPTCAAGSKIGIMDTKRILSESLAAKKAREALMIDLKEKNAVYKDKEKEVLDLEKELNEVVKEGKTETIKEKSNELNQEVKDLKRLKADLEEALNRQNRELTEKILREVSGVVKKYRKDKKYTLILDKKSVITSDDSIDITDRIMEIYDKQRQP